MSKKVFVGTVPSVESLEAVAKHLRHIELCRDGQESRNFKEVADFLEAYATVITERKRAASK